MADNHRNQRQAIHPAAAVAMAEDIEHLRDEWVRDPPDAVVRRGSVILRRLLVEGQLQQAWKAAGFEREPTVTAPDLDVMIGEDRRELSLAVAGGALSRGMNLAGLQLWRRAEIPGPRRDPSDCEHVFGLAAFISSAALATEFDRISRREIVKYFANVMGGAHLQLSSRVRKGEEELVKRLDRIRAQSIQLANRDALYFELMSIGQALGRSEDVSRLADALRKSA